MPIESSAFWTLSIRSIFNRRNNKVEVAKAVGEISNYIKQRGIDDEYCKKIILDYLSKFDSALRDDLENVLLDKLPEVLDIQQKRNIIKNNLQSLRQLGDIEVNGKIRRMSKLKN